MLERTATTLEPCSLQRVLPATRTCLQSRRQLHTAFWNHGAAELEPLDAFQAAMPPPPSERKTPSTPLPAESNKRPDTMRASGVLLDFLYPRGTAALLRRLYPMHPARLDSDSNSPRHMARLFTSGPPRQRDKYSDSLAEADPYAELEDGPEGEFRERQVWEIGPEGQEGAEEPVEEEEVFSDPEALQQLLHSDRAGAYDQVYQLYANLEPSLKDEFTTPVLLAISTSTRPIEAWRVNELFALYDVEEWTEQLVRAAVKAQLTLHNANEAMDIFRTAMGRHGFGRALDYLLTYGLETPSWDMVIEAWELYVAIKKEEVPVFVPEQTPEPTADSAVDSTMTEGAEAMGESLPLQSAEDGVESAVAQDARPLAEQLPSQEAESAVDSTAIPDTEAGVESTTVQDIQPAESAPSRDVEAVAELATLLEKEPAAAQDTEAGVESTTVQDVEPAADSTTIQNNKPAVEPAAVQDAELDSRPMPAQAPKDTVEPPAAGQDTESVDAPRGVQDSQPVAESPAVQDAGAAVGLKAEQNPELLGTDGSATEQSTWSALTYPRLAAMPNFETQMRDLYASFRVDPDSMHKRTALMDSLLRHLAKHSLALFQPADAVFILERARDPDSYKRYILLSAEQERKKLASDIYRKYRALPGVRVADSVLRVMLDIFFPHNARGMEQLLEDWYRSYGRLDERAYQKFMAFHGGRGDVKSVMKLAKEYATHYDSKVEEDPKFVANLMHAYAVKGDPEAARKVMEEAAEKLGTPPDMKQWNILLNAHTKAGDYEGAIHLFYNLCEEQVPDDFTFGTIMGMAAWRGDLQFVLELFQLARTQSIRPTVAMMRTVVEAYCQNDRYAEAESLCTRLTKSREMTGDYTLLWNTLLQHNAKRRDLTTVNRLLEFMSAEGIAYNQETYSQLLLALLYCRQSHHAMHLLRVAHREGVFEPTPEHFLILMSAFMKSGEPHMALKTNELMSSMHYPNSAKRMTKVIDALGRWQQLPASKRRNVDSQYFLKKIMREFYKTMQREDDGAPDDIRSTISLYSKVIFILTQMREHATVQQLINLHNSRYPTRASPETLPLRLLHNIMLDDFHEKKYDRVKEVWSLVFSRATVRYRTAAALLDNSGPGEAPSQGPKHKVAYAQRFRLCDPLKTMQRLFLEEQDAAGLLNLVATVRNRGFDLDSKNWNYHVQALARLKKWREAFSICEEVLMPQWTGWYMVRARESTKNRIPLELRRIGTNPDRPRPIAHTLLILAKEYMDLEQMMLWSHEAGREFKFITDQCPKTVRAVTTMMRSGSALEAQIFGDLPPPPPRRRGGDGEEGEEDEGLWEEQDEGQERLEERGVVREEDEGQWEDVQEERKPTYYHDAFTDDGLLNVGGPAQPKGLLSEEDIIAGIKGEVQETGAGSGSRGKGKGKGTGRGRGRGKRV